MLTVEGAGKGARTEAEVVLIQLVRCHPPEQPPRGNLVATSARRPRGRGRRLRACERGGKYNVNHHRSSHGTASPRSLQVELNRIAIQTCHGG